MEDFEEEEKNQNNKKLGCKGKILALQSTPPPLADASAKNAFFYVLP